jgi:hypothetical protein
MSKANLVVQFKTPQADIHEKLIAIMDYYDGHEATVYVTGGLESIRYYWYDVPNNLLSDVATRLSAEGARFKILPLGVGNYEFP